jgi:hypothetical protein
VLEIASTGGHEVGRHGKREERKVSLRDGTLRYYGDLRILGGRPEALKLSREPRARATSDRDVAEKLVADRVNELLTQRDQADRLVGGIH